MKIQVREQITKKTIISSTSLFIIQRLIDVELSNNFAQRCFSGYNIFASRSKPQEALVIEAKVKEIDYNTKMIKIGDID